MKVIFAVMALGTVISTYVAVAIVGQSGPYISGLDVGLEYSPEAKRSAGTL